jgi:hypothetical protein
MTPNFCELFLTSTHFGIKVNKKRSISNNPVETPEKWVDLYGNYLYRFALYRVYEATVAEDLVQETFLAALGSFKNFQYRFYVKQPAYIPKAAKTRTFQFNYRLKSVNGLKNLWSVFWKNMNRYRLENLT